MSDAADPRSSHPYLVVGVVYFASILVADALGFDMRIEWHYYQLLDPEELRSHPWTSLALLHSQPPLLNALLSLCLGVSGWLGCDPALPLEAFFVALGLVASCAFYDVASNFTQRRGLVALALFGVLIHPGVFFFQNLAFYPFILHCLLLVFAALGVRLLGGGRDGLLIPAALVLALVTNTRALFHPVFTGALFGLLVLARAFVDTAKPLGRRDAALAGALLVLLLVAWPAKNLFLFEEFTYSSWSGYNLAHGTDVRAPALGPFLRRGVVTPRVAEELAVFQASSGFEHTAAVSKVDKGDGSRNWNHWTFLHANARLTDAALRWRLDHLGAWADDAVRFYWAWSRSTYTHPYSGALRGPDGDTPPDPGSAYGSFAGIHHAVFFADLRPLLERAAPLLVPESLRSTPLPMTLFGAFLFPAVMLPGFLLALRLRRRSPQRAAAVVLVWLPICWVMAVACLSDGSEANRMRFSVGGLFVLLSVALAEEALGALSRRGAGR